MSCALASTKAVVASDRLFHFVCWRVMLCNGASSILGHAEFRPYTTLGNIGAYIRVMEIATRRIEWEAIMGTV